MYLAVSDVAVSAVPFREGEQEGKTCILCKLNVIRCRDLLQCSREYGVSFGEC